MATIAIPRPTRAGSQQSLEALAKQGAGLMITPSRRTPERLLARLSGAMREHKALFWDGSGQNPYPDFLAHADLFVITADSVSMTCEAAATGRPIYIFSPSGGSAKFNRFHEALAAYGATRPLPAAGQADRSVDLRTAALGRGHRWRDRETLAAACRNVARAGRAGWAMTSGAATGH